MNALSQSSPRRGDRERLLQIVAASLSHEPFLRSDGRHVTSYVQGHLFLGDPAGLRLACSLMLEAIQRRGASAVVGEVSAACALVSGVVALSDGTPQPLLGRYLRKELKPYGIPGWLNAPLPAGSRVFLVDDVAATGASAERCVRILRSLGHEVVAMMVVVDRNQGAAERLGRLGVELQTLFSLDEIKNAGAELWRTAASG